MVIGRPWIAAAGGHLVHRDAESAVAGKAHHRHVRAADLGAEDRREAVAARAEQPRRQVFAALLEARIGVADGAVVADVGGDDRLLRQRGLDGPPGHARRHPLRLALARALVPVGARIVVLVVHRAQLLQPGRARPVDQRLALRPARLAGAGRQAARGSARPPAWRRPGCRPSTFLVSPMRSELMSTWMIFASRGQ